MLLQYRASRLKSGPPPFYCVLSYSGIYMHCIEKSVAEVEMRLRG